MHTMHIMHSLVVVLRARTLLLAGMHTTLVASIIIILLRVVVCILWIEIIIH